MLEKFQKILNIFDENSIEKVNFLKLFLENLLLKIEPSEITPVFCNNSSGFGGHNFRLPLNLPMNIEFCDRVCQSRNEIVSQEMTALFFILIRILSYFISR